MLGSLFGGETAAKVLLFLENYGEAYVREVARTYGIAHPQVRSQLVKLEEAGYLVSRTQGRTRVYTWNPRNPLVPPLREMLATGLRILPESEKEAYFRQRRRPRRIGKPL